MRKSIFPASKPIPAIAAGVVPGEPVVDLEDRASQAARSWTQRRPCREPRRAGADPRSRPRCRALRRRRAYQGKRQPLQQLRPCRRAPSAGLPRAAHRARMVRAMMKTCRRREQDARRCAPRPPRRWRAGATRAPRKWSSGDHALPDPSSKAPRLPGRRHRVRAGDPPRHDCPAALAKRMTRLDVPARQQPVTQRPAERVARAPGR